MSLLHYFIDCYPLFLKSFIIPDLIYVTYNMYHIGIFMPIASNKGCLILKMLITNTKHFVYFFVNDSSSYFIFSHCWQKRQCI